MAHLYKFRKGWENENLARFILSKFSFVAQPASVSDDIGSDFYCTLFQRKEIEKDEYLFPKSTFAIQIKSNKRNINSTNKIEYLNNLELPFFVGVINQKDQTLTIYSGEYIPRFLSYVGLPERLGIKLVDKREGLNVKPRQKKYILPFPKVCEIKADIGKEDLQKISYSIYHLCFHVNRNIASRKSDECLFYDYPDLQPFVIAGRGSAEVFRINFMERLAEVYCNLKWFYPQLNNQPDIDKFMKEYNVYKNLYFEIEKLYGKSDLLSNYFMALKNEVENK